MPKIILFVWAIFAVGCATKLPAHHRSQQSPPLKKGQTIKVKTTAYTHTERGGRRTAIGTRLSHGIEKSASADWARFPLGTKFTVLGTGDVYRVEDYGSALVGKETIDLYKPCRVSMRSWGVRHVDIKILEWGSPEKSLEVLMPRSRNPHVRSMINDLREQI